MLRSNSIRCGNCGATSEHTVLMRTNAFGSPDIDLRPPAMQRWIMDTCLQFCPACEYCAPDLSQPPADPAVLRSEAYRAALRAAAWWRGYLGEEG